MEKFATENLILLEFLVDQLKLDYEVQKDLKTILGDTCVSFQFLDNAPLLICEQDFTIKHPCAIRDQTNIKNGKSCLFSLTPQQAEQANKQFDVHVEIFKKMKPGILPEKLPVGESLISIVNLFQELVESLSAEGESPTAKTLKDCFKITNVKGMDVGHISVYIRMSCFGKLIVTQFQMNLEDKSVQFRAKEGHYLFKYNKGKAGPGCVDWQKGQQGGSPPCPLPIVSCTDNMSQEHDQSCPMQPCIFQPPRSPPMSSCCMPQPPPSPCCMPPPSPCPMPQPSCCMPQPMCPMPQPQPPCGICGTPQPPCGQPPRSPCGPPSRPPCGPPPSAPCGICGMPQPPPCVAPQPPCGICGTPQPPCALPPPPCGMCGTPQPPCTAPKPPCGVCGMPQPPPCGVPSMPPCAMRLDPPCAECTAPPDPRAAYQEIGAAMGGNALTIRVHKDKGKIEQVTESDLTCSSCSCAMENYSKKSRKQRRCGTPTCCTPAPAPCYAPPPCYVPSCSPPACYSPPAPPACCAMQQSLAMRPGAPDPNSPFAFKMGGCGGGANDNITVNPPHCVTQDGTCFTELSDPAKDVFVLRIGKKSECAEKKNNLELELCTPKGPCLKPTPKKETRDTQYLESDIPDAIAPAKSPSKGGKGKGKGKGKGGKGKGKGGKKGKKGKKK